MSKLLHPILSLMRDNRTVGVLLLLCTAISLTWANLPGGAAYINFWKMEISWLHDLHL
ncbi:MAG: hypothetical protein EOP48_18660, partial [Sphingobacteriales bacterium]